MSDEHKTHPPVSAAELSVPGARWTITSGSNSITVEADKNGKFPLVRVRADGSLEIETNTP